MDDFPDLTAYTFHQEEWDDYDELCERFQWEVPESLNVVTYLCDRWAESEPRRPAVHVVADDSRRTYTFQELRDQGNQLANFLESRGVGYGDRIGVSGLRRSKPWSQPWPPGNSARSPSRSTP